MMTIVENSLRLHSILVFFNYHVMKIVLIFFSLIYTGPVGWDWGIHTEGLDTLQLMSWYNTKQSDGEAQAMLEF